MGAATLSTVVAEGSSSSSTCKIPQDLGAGGKESGVKQYLENADVHCNNFASADGGVQKAALKLLPQAGDHQAVLIRTDERGS
jgi:hypothetical protein